MTPPAPSPAAPAKPVEKKVTWATVGTYLGSVAGLAILNAVSSDATLISGLPDWLETLLLPVIPAGIAFLSGYQARHTPRPDLVPGAADKGRTGAGGVYRDGYGSDPDPFGK